MTDAQRAAVEHQPAGEAVGGGQDNRAGAAVGIECQRPAAAGFTDAARQGAGRRRGRVRRDAGVIQECDRPRQRARLVEADRTARAVAVAGDFEGHRRRPRGRVAEDDRVAGQDAHAVQRSKRRLVGDVEENAGGTGLGADRQAAGPDVGAAQVQQRQIGTGLGDREVPAGEGRIDRQAGVADVRGAVAQPDEGAVGKRDGAAGKDVGAVLRRRQIDGAELQAARLDRAADRDRRRARRRARDSAVAENGDGVEGIVPADVAGAVPPLEFAGVPRPPAVGNAGSGAVGVPLQRLRRQRQRGQQQAEKTGQRPGTTVRKRVQDGFFHGWGASNLDASPADSPKTRFFRQS